MLAELQKQLADIYQVDPGYRVTDFLITDPALASLLGQQSMLENSPETVLLSQDDDGIALSVFLDEEMLDRLGAGDPLCRLAASQLNDLWTVLEGISHFNYIAWNAACDKRVTLLELELQAEIDKFVSTWLLAQQQQRPALAERLHDWLFDEVSFRTDLTIEQRVRYEMANNYAARFCSGLRRRLQKSDGDGLQELRRFYRLGQSDKLSHIHAQSYA